MPRVWVPPQARDLTAGREVVEAAGSRVRQVLDELDRQYPGIKARLCDGDRPRPGLMLVIGSDVARLGLAQPVEADSEIYFLPAIGGGQEIGPDGDRE